jgi:ABC-2 type transport system permease protein
MFKAGSIPWLLAHEMRLGWREAMGARGRYVGLVAGGFVLVVLVGAGVGLGMALRHYQLEVSTPAVLIADLALAFIFTLMLSQTLAAAAQALYSRGDLDLLFSSPLPPRTVLTVRFTALALNVVTLFAALAGGLLLPIAFLGHPQWLGVLPVLMALALLASAAGLVLASALFRLLGPRRTRTIAQVLAAVIGAAIFLVFQSGNMMGGDRRAMFERIAGVMSDRDLALPPLADLPLRAMLGEPWPLLAIFGLSVVAFLAVNTLLGRRFARDSAAAVGVDGVGRKAKARTGDFASGAFAATLRKELRLLLRDAALLSQVLLRVLYLLPLAFVLLRNAGEGQSLLLPGGAAGLAVMAGQLASSLTWITVSAEDAPDLLVAAPAPISTVNRAKLAAALIPVAGLLALPLVALIVLAPAAGIAATLGCAASASSAGMINVWRQRPGRRSDFRRKGSVHWFFTVAILLIGGLIGTATFFAASLQLWAIIPAVLAAVFTLALRKSDAAIIATLRDQA